jgi:pimeloyl-ACP methyl ester carboxylesterase
MAAYVFVPGAGGRGWAWHLVVEELRQAGQQAVAVDLPGPDPAADLFVYRDLIAAAARPLGGPVTLVAHSLGGFSAPLACTQVPVAELVLYNAMIPRPGESAGEWGDNTGAVEAAQQAAASDGRPPVDYSDTEALFYHDVPGPLADEMRARSAMWDEGPAVFAQPWPLAAWPAVPVRVLAGRDDRLFPLELQRRVARDRLGLEAEQVPGGHLGMLGYPAELAAVISR